MDFLGRMNAEAERHEREYLRAHLDKMDLKNQELRDALISVWGILRQVDGNPEKANWESYYTATDRRAQKARGILAEIFAPAPEVLQKREMERLRAENEALLARTRENRPAKEAKESPSFWNRVFRQGKDKK